jgi:hypothetical protein
MTPSKKSFFSSLLERNIKTQPQVGEKLALEITEPEQLSVVLLRSGNTGKRSSPLPLNLAQLRKKKS